MPHIYQQRELAQLLVSRLERLSADSLWAHRASGIRGALSRALSNLDDPQPNFSHKLPELIKSGFDILEAAAKESL